eukprot:1636005-Prymnesium_polylepis.2
MFSGARTASAVTHVPTELVRIDREAYNEILMQGSGKINREKVWRGGRSSGCSSWSATAAAAPARRALTRVSSPPAAAVAIPREAADVC